VTKKFSEAGKKKKMLIGPFLLVRERKLGLLLELGKA
jgi:hypothetical protein